jgi:hypothetical protein
VPERIDISQELAALIAKLGVGNADTIAEIDVRPKLVTVVRYVRDVDGFTIDPDTGDAVMERVEIEVET